MAYVLTKLFFLHYITRRNNINASITSSLGVRPIIIYNMYLSVSLSLYKSYKYQSLYIDFITFLIWVWMSLSFIDKALFSLIDTRPFLENFTNNNPEHILLFGYLLSQIRFYHYWCKNTIQPFFPKFARDPKWDANLI